MSAETIDVSQLSLEIGQIQEKELLSRFDLLLKRIKSYALPIETGRPAPNNLSSSYFKTESLPIEIEKDDQIVTSDLSFFIYCPPESSQYYPSIISSIDGHTGPSIGFLKLKANYREHDFRVVEKLGQVEKLVNAYESKQAELS